MPAAVPPQNPTPPKAPAEVRCFNKSMHGPLTGPPRK